jgi:hypothetical protein
MGDEKLGREEFFGGFSSCVIFLGKGRRRMRNLSRWGKRESGLDVWGTSKE